MKRAIFTIALAAALLPIAASAQIFTSVAPESVVLTSANPVIEYEYIEGVKGCSITVPPAAAFGGATLSVLVSSIPTGGDWSPISGVADPGNPSLPASSLTAPGTLVMQLVGRAAFEVSLSGGSGASIPIDVDCTY